MAVLKLVKLGPGWYGAQGYTVERIGNAWRWHNPQNPGQGGEWRQTKRDAVIDLAAFLGLAVQGKDGQ